MTSRFIGKVALVTGGGAGIGAATVRRLASEGAKLVITGRRREPLDAIAAETGAIVVVGDSSDEAHIIEAVATAEREFGGLDVVVANAGVGIGGGAEDIPMADYQRAMAVNLEGPLLLARHAVPAMRKRGGGAIVLVSSVAALSAGGTMVSYCISKTALIGLSRSLAYDYGVDNIRSNVICPGWTESEMTQGMLQFLSAQRGITPEEMNARVVRPLPLRRGAKASEQAAAIAFLASEDASFITGAVLVADGGGAIVDAATMAFAD